MDIGPHRITVQLVPTARALTGRCRHTEVRRPRHTGRATRSRRRMVEAVPTGPRHRTVAAVLTVPLRRTAVAAHIARPLLTAGVIARLRPTAAAAVRTARLRLRAEATDRRHHPAVDHTGRVAVVAVRGEAAVPMAGADSSAARNHRP